MLDQFGVSKDLSIAAQNELAAVLAAFPTVSAPMVGLLPERGSDHRIVLQPGAQPVSVRPYRYNTLQKTRWDGLSLRCLQLGLFSLATVHILVLSSWFARKMVLGGFVLVIGSLTN